jgi:hypothetical protein
MIIILFAFLFLLLLSYGIYLLSLINKDLSDNKVLPDYVKKNLKLVGSLSTVAGLVGLAFCGWLTFGKNKLVNNKFDKLFQRPLDDYEFENTTLESIDQDSEVNFGFKFY